MVTTSLSSDGSVPVFFRPASFFKLFPDKETEDSDRVPQPVKVETHGRVSSSLGPGWLREVRLNSAISPETVPEGSGSPHSSSSTISASVTSSSSCSWEISSSKWASSSCIQQSSMMFSYLIMDLSTALREVCRVLNLCSISRLDGTSVITSMVWDTTSNSLCSLVCRLLHFCREEAASVHFFSMCLRFSLRTWVTTSSNCSSQAVPGPRK